MIKLNFKFYDFANPLVYHCVDVIVHGSDDEIRDTAVMLKNFRDFLDLIVDDYNEYVLKKESEEKNV